jgi:putative ATP-dependent endonuclease of OLD family
MRIRHVKIERFRGIKLMDWTVGNSIVCLIGPGDSTKSTILDAIDYALTTTRYLEFSYVDFYNAKPEQGPIEITLTIGDLTEEFIDEEKYGLLLQGWNSEQHKLVDEPEGDTEKVISIRLKVDVTLQPSWMVVGPRQEERRIGHADRAKVGVARIGADVDQHLCWKKGSAISRLTEDPSAARPILARLFGDACRGFSCDNLDELNEAAKQAMEIAKRYGITPRAAYKPQIDPNAVHSGTAALCLYDESLPLRLLGFGSRRLVTIGLQLAAVKQGGILLIDEVEHGLEPHRIRQLIRTITEETTTQGQIIMTSHSPTPMLELEADHIYVVRNRAGMTEVRQTNSELQSVIRQHAPAMLARRIIVCEGKTEVGLCRGLDSYWAEKLNGLLLAHLGVEPINGGGTNACTTAQRLAQLDYEVALLIDADKPLPVSASVLEPLKIKLIRWDEGSHLEQQICNDIPFEGLKKIIDVALSEGQTEDSVRGAVAHQLGLKPTELGNLNPGSWTPGKTQDQIRKAVGSAAGAKGWFKDIEPGSKLAGTISEYLPKIANTTLAKRIDELGAWIHGDRRANSCEE